MARNIEQILLTFSYNIDLSKFKADKVKLPDVVVIIDPKRESTAVLECRKLGIPIISILDTNCDPNLIDIPIPANDDAVRSIKLIISALSDAIINGKQASY